jgi:uncharacterized membrane protein YdfJ with MMPL/SSD domain
MSTVPHHPLLSSAHAVKVHGHHIANRAYSSRSSGWSHRIFGWVLHAAIWHFVGHFMATHPWTYTVIALILLGLVLSWVTRAALRVTRRQVRRQGARLGRGAARTAIRTHTGQPPSINDFR